MKFQQFSFGQIRIDGIEYGYDVVIDRGKAGKRKKKASKKFREALDTRRSRWKRISRGNAVAWWSARAKEHYRSWMRSNVRLSGAEWNCSSSQRKKPWSS